MVCDGSNLWFLDRDLKQVTVKPVDAALTATPAMLLSGTADCGRISRSRLRATAPALNGCWPSRWRPMPTSAVRCFGFANGELRRMIVEDKLGQTATIMFDKITRNVPVAPADVELYPAEGC